MALLDRGGVPFSEVSAHRATLEEAYLELTRDAVEFRAAAPGAGEARGSGAPLHAEWTKFRTVRGWVVGDRRWPPALIVGARARCRACRAPAAHGPACALPVGPGGEEVTDSFTFVHRPLTGDGSITVRVASLDRRPAAGPTAASRARRSSPWAKAGLIVKDGTRPGSTLRGGHGHRRPRRADAARLHPRPRRARRRTVRGPPRWLRLTRTGDTVTGAESADGATWTTVGTVRLPGLPATVGDRAVRHLPAVRRDRREASAPARPAARRRPPRPSTALDDRGRLGRRRRLDRRARRRPGARAAGAGRSRRRAGAPATRFTRHRRPATSPRPSPAPPASASPITQTLVGTFAGLIVVVVVGALFVTAEYRRGLIRTTLAASPRRGRVLAAKAIVRRRASTFVAGAGRGRRRGHRSASAVLRGNGVYVHRGDDRAPSCGSSLGTAALLAVAAVLALGARARCCGAAPPRSPPPSSRSCCRTCSRVTVLPAGAGDWLLRVTPAAAFAVQQSAPRVRRRSTTSTRRPTATSRCRRGPGLAVLAGWAALALGLAAVVLLRRRDA